MTKTPCLSILMSVYNESPVWLEKSIESILNQSFRDFEYVILLDNPENRILEEVILNYAAKDQRVRFMKNDSNLGLVASLNRGLKSVRGEYVARMDADDIAEPERLEVQLKYLKDNPEIDLVGSDISFIDEKDGKVEEASFLVEDERIIKKLISSRNLFNHPTLMFKRQVVCGKDINGYRHIACAEDYDLICRLISSGYHVANINRKLLKYRIRSSGISQKNFLLQLKTTAYVGRLYSERLVKGCDSYADTKGVTVTAAEEENFLKAVEVKEKAVRYKEKGKHMLFILLSLKSLLMSKYRILDLLNRRIFSLKYNYLIKASGRTVNR